MLFFDIVSGKKIYECDSEGILLEDMHLSSDGQSVYFLINDNIVCQNISTGEQTNVAEKSIKHIMSNTDCKKFNISESGKYLALATANNKLIVIDTEADAVVLEKDFLCAYLGEMFFDENEQHIITQGEDRYIKLYRLTDGENLYTSEGQANDIIQVLESGDGNSLVLVTSLNMIVLEKESYIPVAIIDGGCYFTDENLVIVQDYQGVYSFPFQTIDSLKEEAGIQFEGAFLTDAKKIRYHI